jgi:site-specific recombinase XerD
LQNARSVTGGFFDYDAALSLRDMALTAGVGMPHYLLAPEVCQLLDYLPDLKQRLFAETLWNTGARLNECLALTPSDFKLVDKRTRQPLARPFVVLRTLKQRGRGRGRPSGDEVLNRIVPLFDAAYVRRLREYVVTFRPLVQVPLWNVKSDETPRNWIRSAVQRAERDGVTFSLSTITPKTFRHSFAMHLIQNLVPMKVVQAYMGHTEVANTEIYTKVFALDVGFAREVRFTVPVEGVTGLMRDNG